MTRTLYVKTYAINQDLLYSTSFKQEEPHHAYKAFSLRSAVCDSVTYSIAQEFLENLAHPTLNTEVQDGNGWDNDVLWQCSSVYMHNKPSLSRTVALRPFTYFLII